MRGFLRADSVEAILEDVPAENVEPRKSRSRAPIISGSFGGACFGGTVALGMQLYTNWSYPINVGGRPIYALSAFAVVTFELTVLFGALGAAFGMLTLNRLPRLHEPVFSGSRFHLASRDRFFLYVVASDPCFDEKATPRFLQRVGARSVEVLPL